MNKQGNWTCQECVCLDSRKQVYEINSELGIYIQVWRQRRNIQGGYSYTLCFLIINACKLMGWKEHESYKKKEHESLSKKDK